MARDRIQGITIEIAGDTSKLTKSIKDTKQSLVDTQKELSGVNKLLKLDPKNVTLLKQKQELLTKAIGDSEERLKNLKEVQEKFGDTSKLTDEQKEKYRYLEREIALCENQLKSYKEEQASVSKGEPFKPIIKDVEELGQKSLKTGDIIKANLVSQAIISGVKSLASAFKSAVGTLNSWSDQAQALEEQESKLTRVLKNTTNASDKQIQSIIELTAEEEKMGVVSQETQLAGLQELGTYIEHEKTLKKLLPVMNDMIAQQYGVGASMESASSIATMMGKVLGNGQVSALSKLGYKFDKTQEKVLKFGTEEQKAAMLATVISQSVGGINKALAETDAGKIEILNSYFDDIKKSAGKAFSTIKVGLADTFIDEIENFSYIFGGLFEKAITLDKAIEGVTYTIGLMIEKVNDSLVGKIGRSLPKIMKSIANFIKQNAPILLNTIIQVSLEFVKAIGEALPDVIPLLVDGLLDMVDVILDNIDLFIDAAIAIIKGLATGLIRAIPNLIEKIPEIIEKLIDAIIDNFPKLLQTGIDLVIEIGKGLIEGIPELVKKIPSIITKMIEKFKENMGKFVEIGKNIVEGIGRGLEAGWNLVKVKYKTLPQEIAEWFKEKLGIASPSKVMRDEVGKNISLGIAKGIIDNMGAVENAMSSLSGGIEASVNPVINPTANTNPLYINIDKFVNNRETDIQQLAEELEFYRKNSALAKGGV